MTPTQQLMHMHVTCLDRLIWMAETPDELLELANQVYRLAHAEEYQDMLTPILCRRLGKAYSDAASLRVKMLKRSELDGLI